jgi:hypothetical protein
MVDSEIDGGVYLSGFESYLVGEKPLLTSAIHVPTG